MMLLQYWIELNILYLAFDKFKLKSDSNDE